MRRTFSVMVILASAAAACSLINGLDEFERIEGKRPTGEVGGASGTGGSQGGGGQGGGGGGHSGGGGHGGGGGYGGATGTTCGDGIQNGGETGVDCGGGVCPGCLGDACAAHADCKLSFCVDGVCCDTECSGVCQACTLTKKRSGADGACGPIGIGTDPDNDCTDQGAPSCGTDGACNGTGACQLYMSGSVCAAQSCAAGVQQNAGTCDGLGACVPGGTTNCSPYICGGTSCKTSCVNSMDCLAGSGTYCSMMQCVPKKADGQPCMGNNQCQSNVCKLGICRPVQCGNMMLDGNETDVDCGGVCGATCATGQGCVAVADCAPPNTQCTGLPATCQP